MATDETELEPEKTANTETVQEEGEAVSATLSTAHLSSTQQGDSRSLLASCDGTSAIGRVLCSASEGIKTSAEEVMEISGASSLVATLKETATTTKHEEEDDDDPTLDEITSDSDIRPPHRRIWIVTTAALPWRTGTSVNPLLRALYLTRQRPKHHVTLFVPWLVDNTSRLRLYGPEHSFANGGHKEQEEWIRQYCRERAHCEEEEQNLRIRFYKAFYHKPFGSIFPLEDICSLIADDEADVAILEEPEHLNWFRVPAAKSMNSKAEEEESQPDTDLHLELQTGESTSVQETNGTNTLIDAQQISDIPADADENKSDLGWAQKFRHVIGIIHTNYSAYMTEYAMGTSFIAAPAISILSSIVVRAYCHRVIRLSDALPSLAASREVTSNVHGVRSEFLLPPESKKDAPTVDTYAPVYFIGKLIWAKGFSQALEIQDLYRHTTGGDYFAMDIYGAGPDEKAIKRAFLGRNGRVKRESLSPSRNQPTISANDADAADVFEKSDSLRRQMSILSGTTEASSDSIEVVSGRTSAETSDMQITASASEDSGITASERGDAISILGDLGSTSISTGLETSQAVYSLAESLVKAGLKLTTLSRPPRDEEARVEEKSFFSDPPKSRYEWRRHAIPARFLGVKDHVELRDIKEHKIFLNPSTSEVLCTTTAEALAMNKFVILPNHPSNTFFLQFPNCLPYNDLSECVDKLRWALENSPTPLTEEVNHKFSWEGATERLFAASGITQREVRKRQASGTDEADMRMAWFHSASGKTRRLIGNMFVSKSSDGSESK